MAAFADARSSISPIDLCIHYVPCLGQYCWLDLRDDPMETHANTHLAVLPVFLFTGIEKGGFGFSPQWISYFLACLAASQGLWTLAYFPSLKRKLGTGPVMRLCSAGWPLLFASFAILNELLRRGWFIAFWTTLPLSLIVGGGIAMSFGTYGVPFVLDSDTDLRSKLALNYWSTTPARPPMRLRILMPSPR